MKSLTSRPTQSFKTRLNSLCQKHLTLSKTYWRVTGNNIERESESLFALAIPLMGATYLQHFNEISVHLLYSLNCQQLNKENIYLLYPCTKLKRVTYSPLTH